MDQFVSTQCHMWNVLLQHHILINAHTPDYIVSQNQTLEGQYIYKKSLEKH